MTFLAYAILDDRNGTDAMNSVVADYVDSMLQENAQSVGSGPIEANNLGLATLTLSEFHVMSIFPKSADAVYAVSPEIETIANGLKILNDPPLKKEDSFKEANEYHKIGLSQGGNHVAAA